MPQIHSLSEHLLSKLTAFRKEYPREHCYVNHAERLVHQYLSGDYIQAPWLVDTTPVPVHLRAKKLAQRFWERHAQTGSKTCPSPMFFKELAEICTTYHAVVEIEGNNFIGFIANSNYSALISCEQDEPVEGDYVPDISYE